MNYLKAALVALCLIYLQGCLVAAAPLIIQGSVMAVSAVATELDEQQTKNDTNATRNTEIDKTIDEFLSRKQTGNYTMSGSSTVPGQSPPQETGEDVLYETLDAPAYPQENGEQAKNSMKSRELPSETGGKKITSDSDNAELTPVQNTDQETEELIQLLEELRTTGQAVSTNDIIAKERQNATKAKNATKAE